jgi:hypothetical protein
VKGEMKMAEKTYSIKELAAKVELSECYIRRSIHNGNLQSTMKPLDKNSKIKRHEITMTQFEEFRKNRKSQTSRKDGRNRCIGWFNDEEKSAIVEFMENELNIENAEELLVYQNVKR